MEGIALEEGKYGVRAVLNTAWSNEMTSFLLHRGVAELELNDGKGWRGDSLDFLAELPQLKSFTILDLRITSVEPIHFLHELRVLKLITYCKSEIRFSEFPQLQDCGLEWRQKAGSLFTCTTLKSLFVNRYRGKIADPFGQLTNLESLTLLNAPIASLTGLSSLRQLRYLRLGSLKSLRSLAGVQVLSTLEELNIQLCKNIGAISEIGYLSKLRKLFLDNDGSIESLKPLANLTELEWVLFCESTNILDGDLSPLLTQKSLLRVSFQNRKHYSHRREHFIVRE